MSDNDDDGTQGPADADRVSDSPADEVLPMRLDQHWHAQGAAEAQAQARRMGRICDGIALLRFAILVLLILGIAAVAATPGALPIIGSLVVAGLWLAAALVHGVYLEHRDRWRRRAAYHQHGEARCQDADWPQHSGRAASADADHPFAHDLDLTGAQGLLARLDTCGSQAGREQLWAWFLDEDLSWSPERAAAVRALQSQHCWRAELAVAASPRRGARAQDRGWGASGLMAWAATEHSPAGPLLSIAAIMGSLLMLAALTLAGWYLGVAAVLMAALLLVAIGHAIDKRQLAYCALDRIDADAEVDAIGSLRQGLRQVQALDPVAAEQVQLRALCERARNADQALAALQRLVAALARRSNPLWTFGPGALLLSGLHLSVRLRRWAVTYRDSAADWQATLGEAEALAALATWAAEQPGCWPTIDGAGPIIEAEDLQHPLLPRGSRVGNPCHLDDGQVLILTGANASGKSTWLRTISLSVLLARAGTTVPARSCRLRPQRLATVMRVHDDLSAGRSRFQAEVARLADALGRCDHPGPVPLLVFDEILGGTNSQERHAGTVAIIRRRLGKAGCTLVATHDLALASLATIFPEQVQLAHFADTADADSRDLQFDYRIRPGVIKSTNALRVMRAAGLPVDED